MAGSSRLFGIVQDVSGLSTGIIVNSINYTQNSETAEARNEKGKVIDIAVVTTGEQITVDGLATSGGVTVGSVITIGEKKYLITGASAAETNTTFKTQNVTARYSKDCEYWTLDSNGDICDPSETTNSDGAAAATPSGDATPSGGTP